jgi:hypothetical protein
MSQLCRQCEYPLDPNHEFSFQRGTCRECWDEDMDIRCRASVHTMMEEFKLERILRSFRDAVEVIARTAERNGNLEVSGKYHRLAITLTQASEEAE